MEEMGSTALYSRDPSNGVYKKKLPSLDKVKGAD